MEGNPMNLKQKMLILFFIFLMVNTANITSITAVKISTSDENEFVEYSVTGYDLSDVNPRIVTLPQKDAEMIERLFDEIKKNIDAAKTQEEINEIFTDAVLQFDNYGLLGDIPLDDAQQLILGSYKNTIKNTFFIKPTLGGLDDNENIDCFIVGKTSNTYFLSRVVQLIDRIGTRYQNFTEKIYKFVDYCSSKNIIMRIIGAIIYQMVNIMNFLVTTPLVFIFVLSFLYSNFLQVNHIKNIICFGDVRSDGGYHAWSDYPAEGWVTTHGVNGVKKWEGDTIWGDLPLKPFSFSLADYTYPGVYGFTGIRIGNFFMGHADWVKIK
jgi:hypothetical protein